MPSDQIVKNRKIKQIGAGWWIGRCRRTATTRDKTVRSRRESNQIQPEWCAIFSPVTYQVTTSAISRALSSRVGTILRLSPLAFFKESSRRL